MNWTELLKRLGRRWYVVGFGVLATTGLCWATMQVVPVEHSATAEVLILPPKSTLNTDGNPYRALGGLNLAADVLARAVSAPQMAKQLVPTGGLTTYTVASDVTSPGPILLIESQGVDASNVMLTKDAVLAQMPLTLDSLQAQAGAPASSLLSMSLIMNDDVPTVDRKSQIRALIVAGVCGLAMTVFLSVGIDALLTRRLVRLRSGSPNDEMSKGGSVKQIESNMRSPGRSARALDKGESSTGRSERMPSTRTAGNHRLRLGRGARETSADFRDSDAQ
jgi:hypothetical protein